MEARFGSLEEIGEFIRTADLSALCEEQEEWNGMGYTIRNRFFDPDGERETVAARPEDSRVVSRGGRIIITPYSGELSWLFGTLAEYVGHNREHVGMDPLLAGFAAGCEGCFRRNPGHSARELMLCALDGVRRMAQVSLYSSDD